MAHITEDRVLESTTTTGTGALTLAGALTGFRAFGSVMTSPSDTCWYSLWAVDANGNATGDYEEGLGTYSAANTLTRTTVLRSSNANSVVALAAGTTKYVAIASLAQKTLQLDAETAAVYAVVPGSQANISTPSSGFAKQFFRSIANRPTPKWLAPSGVDQIVQDSIYDNGWCLYLPNNGTTVGLNYGIAWTSAGTVSHPTPSSTAPAKVNQMKRTRWANVVTTTNQVLGLTTGAAEKFFWRGNAAGLGGFFFHCRFIVELWPAATVRLFVGLSDQTTNPVASDTLAGNCAGLWHDTTEAATVLNFVRRDGTTATKTAITLTEALQAGSAFDFFMYAPPNGSAINYALYDIKNDVWRATDQAITTNLPTNTAFMGPCAAMSNGTANTVVTTTALGIARLYCQSDF